MLDTSDWRVCSRHDHDNIMCKCVFVALYLFQYALPNERTGAQLSLLRLSRELCPAGKRKCSSIVNGGSGAAGFLSSFLSI